MPDTFTPPAPEDVLEDAFVPPSPDDVEEGFEQLPASELAAIEAEEIPKQPARGVVGSFVEGVKQPFKSFAMSAGLATPKGIPVLSDKTLSEHLQEEFRVMNRREPSGIPAQIAETVGGLAGTIGQVVAHSALGSRVGINPRVAIAGTFGASGAYNAFLKAGLNALSEGKSPEEATDIAKKAAVVGLGVGAATGAIMPPGASTFRQALGQGALLGGVGAAGAATGNVAERMLGLQTPVMEGVFPSGGSLGAAGTMAVIPPALFGISRLFGGRATPPPLPRQQVRPPVEPVKAPEAPPTKIQKYSLQDFYDKARVFAVGPDRLDSKVVMPGGESFYVEYGPIPEGFTPYRHTPMTTRERAYEKYKSADRDVTESIPVGPKPAAKRASLEDMGAIEKEAAAQAGEPAGPRKLLVDPYSTPMLERLDVLGGPVSKQVAKEARQIDLDAVTMAGEIGPVVDKARQLASRAFRGGTTWIRELDEVTPNTAIGRMHTLEGADKAEVLAKAPPEAQEMVDAFWDANTTAIGGLASTANVGFAPSGKVQRILTPRGMDIVLEGGGKLREQLIEGNAKANGKTVAETKEFFDQWKATLDEPAPDQAKVDDIAQDFYREFPKAITHVKSGPQWIEVLVSDPVDYLKAATERTARAAAFRKVYPKTDEGRQALVDTHKAVLSELPTPRRREEFNNLIKSLQGHRLDTGIEMGGAGIPGAQPVIEAAQAIARPLKASMLSLSSLANAAETVVGGPSIFLGYRNVLPLLTKDPRRFYKQLEMAGLVDKATRNFAYNPTAPLRSVSRMVSEGIGRLTMSNFFNEVQEYTGSGSAAILADRVRLKDLTAGEVKDLESVLRAMGFRDNFKQIAAGEDPQGLMQFEAQAAPFLSAGHQRPATTSRLGNSRAFNSLFWFHRYPQMVLNQLRGILNNLIEDVQKPSHRQYIGRDSALLAKFVGMKAAQGALMGLIVTAAKEGGEGVSQKIREAREAFGSFLLQSVINAVGGPLQIAQRIGQKADTGEEAAVEALKVSAPVATGIDLFNAATGKGKYNGLGTFDKAAQFLQSKTPAVPAVRSMMGITGLADDNPKLRAATAGFYRWAQKQGYKWPEGKPKDAEFTQAMRKTVKVMERGGEWQEELQKALAIKGEKGGDATKSAKQSLNSRKILRNQFGGALTADELDSLRSWLGEDNFIMLQQRDAMLDAIADAI